MVAFRIDLDKIAQQVPSPQEGACEVCIVVPDDLNENGCRISGIETAPFFIKPGDTEILIQTQHKKDLRIPFIGCKLMVLHCNKKDIAILELMLKTIDVELGPSFFNKGIHYYNTYISLMAVERGVLWYDR